LDDSDVKVHLKTEKLEKAIIADMNRLAVENKFNSLEKIKQVHLVADPFTIENDILTPTMKIKRNIAKKVFQEQINELYARPIGGGN
jgi:long-chain acyl-CoA synthetase